MIKPLTLSFFLNLVSAGFKHGERDDDLGFYHLVSRADDLCVGVDGPTPSIAGWIGLEGDSDARPKRSFFWFFEAEKDPDDAPLMWVFRRFSMVRFADTDRQFEYGRGPGIFWDDECFTLRSPLYHRPKRNNEAELRQVDREFQPVGARPWYSYGMSVNNSQAAAEDVLDFLQRFFKLYPNLARSQLVLADGSYGGTYVAHIGSVIHSHNELLARGNSREIPINLESVVLHNPIFNPLAHYQWLLHYRCFLHQVHNTTTCQELLGYLGPCLEAIELAFEESTTVNSVAAQNICLGQLGAGDTQGVLLEDIRKTCDSDDVFVCYPEYLWANDLFNSVEAKRILRAPNGLEFEGSQKRVGEAFYAAGDIIRPHHKLYEPLLRDGIRILFIIGAQDANCAWPGVLSSIKLLQTPYQREFNSAPDVHWPARNVTVRKAGPGATGQLTYALLEDAGHTVGQDQPVLMKDIVAKFITEVDFF